MIRKLLMSNKSRRSPLSSQLYGLLWEQHMPISYSQLLAGDDIALEMTDLKSILKFRHAHFNDLFAEEDSEKRFLVETFADAKIRYYDAMGDLFGITHQGGIIGMLVCTPVDWNSYYLRSYALKSEFQNRGIMRACLNSILGILKKHDLARVEVDVSPSNQKNIHLLNQLGFTLTGLNLSERWGANIRFTHFLSSNTEAIFLKQFCTSLRPKTKGGIYEKAICITKPVVATSP